MLKLKKQHLIERISKLTEGGRILYLAAGKRFRRISHLGQGKGGKIFHLATGWVGNRHNAETNVRIQGIIIQTMIIINNCKTIYKPF